MTPRSYPLPQREKRQSTDRYGGAAKSRSVTRTRAALPFACFLTGCLQACRTSRCTACSSWGRHSRCRRDVCTSFRTIGLWDETDPSSQVGRRRLSGNRCAAEPHFSGIFGGPSPKQELWMSRPEFRVSECISRCVHFPSLYLKAPKDHAFFRAQQTFTGNQVRSPPSWISFTMSST